MNTHVNERWIPSQDRISPLTKSPGLNTSNYLPLQQADKPHLVATPPPLKSNQPVCMQGHQQPASNPSSHPNFCCQVGSASGLWGKPPRAACEVTRPSKNPESSSPSSTIFYYLFYYLTTNIAPYAWSAPKTRALYINV